MPDTFPALQQDALTVIQTANNLILLARRLRANAERGDADAVRADCAEIGVKGEALGSFCGAFGATARNFVTYADDETDEDALGRGLEPPETPACQPSNPDECPVCKGGRCRGEPS